MTDGSLPLTEPGESTLHTSDAFRVLDVSRMTAWLAAYPLVTLVSADDGRHPRTSVAPLILRTASDGLGLFSHLDRRNPQGGARHGWTSIPGRRARAALVCLAGVVPSETSRADLSAHHCPRSVRPTGHRDAGSGTSAPGHGRRIRKRAGRLGVRRCARYLSGMSKGIAAFELHVRGIEAACKLSQDRDGGEQEAIAARLEQSEVSDDRAIAAMIREALGTEATARATD